MPETAEPQVIVNIDNGLGRIELNKPKAINALGVDMINTVNEALGAWKDDDTVRAVLITGRGERGLCAGGDIKAIYKAITEGSEDNSKFFRHEYFMNYTLSEYPKPVIAVMNGITMGGGVGISAHGSVRIVTDSTKIGMPETTIGLFPDVGATHILARMPQHVGMYLGLTGLPIGAGGAIAYGLADYYVPDASVPELVKALSENPGDVAEVVAQFAQDAPSAELTDDASWVAECFAKDSPQKIVEALRSHESEKAQSTADLLETKSPRSVAVTFELIRRATSLSLADVLEQDLRTATNIAKYPDLAEGIRAQVIDKDRNPKWNPASLAEVDPQEVESIITTPVQDKVFS